MEYAVNMHIIAGAIVYYGIFIMLFYFDNNREKIVNLFFRYFESLKLYIKNTSVRSMEKIKKIDIGTTFAFLLKNTCFLGIFCLLIWTFEHHGLDWFVDNAIKFTNISSKLANIILILSFLGLILMIGINVVYKRSFRLKKYFYCFLILTLLYVRYRFVVPYFNFTTISFVNQPIAYIDIIYSLYVIYIISLIVIDNKCKSLRDKELLNKNDYFYYDGPINTSEDDILKFTPIVNELNKKIETLTREHSWSIGVTGPWGSGKTSLINLMKENLSSEKYLIVNFNPRIISRTAKIQEQALQTLAEAIKPYNSGFWNLIRKYMCSLQLEGVTGWVQFMYSCIKTIYNTTELKRELNEELNKLPKQVIFVFDDFDRLTKEEVIEVLKLIDGTANFKNIIYIAAYDRKYVGDILSSTSYIEKYFNIEIHVPLSKNDNILNFLNTELIGIFGNKNQNDSIALSSEQVLNQHASLFNKAILTIRDAKHYLNTLKADIVVADMASVDIEDFLLLELLKSINTQLYETIFAKPDTYLDFNVKIKLKDGSDVLKGINKIEETIVPLLFPQNNDNDRPNKIRNRNRFFMYFVHHSQNGVINELYAFFDINVDPKEKLQLISQNEETLIDFIYLFDQYGLHYVNSEVLLERYIFIILFLKKINGNRIALLNTWEIFKHSFYYSTVNALDNRGIAPIEMGRYILNFYKESELTEGDITILSAILPELFSDSKNNYIVEKDSILQIIHNNFNAVNKKYCDNHLEKDFNLLINLFYLCIDKIDGKSTKIHLEQKFCDEMKLTIEQYPVDYIRHFVRLAGWSSSRDVNSIACEPFWKQIFGSSSEFEKFIDLIKDKHIPNIKRFINFWSLYSANNYQMIKFERQGNVQEIIENDLTQQVQFLNELYALEEQFLIIEQELNVTIRNNELSALKNRIEEIPLNISYKRELIQKVEKNMNE